MQVYGRRTDGADGRGMCQMNQQSVVGSDPQSFILILREGESPKVVRMSRDEARKTILKIKPENTGWNS